jgi:hypothetical protein
MTPQEAYNKGLDAAESIAVVKLSNALLGNDDGPFNNPQMEDIRQKILNHNPKVIIDKDYNYIVDLIHEKELNLETLSEIDKTVVEILNFCKEIVGPKPRSRVSVKAKKFLAKLEVDLIKNNVKL